MLPVPLATLDRLFSEDGPLTESKKKKKHKVKESMTAKVKKRMEEVRVFLECEAASGLSLTFMCAA